MLKMSFEINGITVSARRLSIRDNDNIGDLLMKLPDGQRNNRMFRFLEFAIAHTTEGGSIIPPLHAHSTLAEIEAAYDVYGELPRTFQSQWQEELQAVEGDPKVSASQTLTG